MTKSASALVGVHEAKTHLSRLLARVEAGEEIAIARRGTVVARLVPASSGRVPTLGLDHGRMVVPDGFDAALPDEVLDAFER